MQIITKHNPYGAGHNEPRMIVIHAMAEYFPTAGDDAEPANEFLGKMKLSAHVLAAPNGTLLKLREDTEGAHHAKGFNTDSLGLEVLLAGRHTYGTFIEAIKRPWVTADQYRVVVWQCQVWLAKHKIERVVRHSDLSPGRKRDPGDGFPWEQFLRDINWGSAA